jgi:hypothetical protein
MKFQASDDQSTKRARDHYELQCSRHGKRRVEPFGFASFRDRLDEIERASKRTTGNDWDA